MHYLKASGKEKRVQDTELYKWYQLIKEVSTWKLARRILVSLYCYFIQILKKSLIFNVNIEKEKELINFLKIVIITHLERSPVKQKNWNHKSYLLFHILCQNTQIFFRPHPDLYFTVVVYQIYNLEVCKWKW